MDGPSQTPALPVPVTVTNFTPVPLAAYNTPGNALAVDISGTVAFVADSSSLQALEVGGTMTGGAVVPRGSLAFLPAATAIARDVKISDKLAAAETLLAQLRLGWDALAAMGDDWPDLPLMARAAFACAPTNAHAEVRAVAHHVTTASGGHGAARECCDLLLTAAGRYAPLLSGHLVTLDDSAR